MSDYGTIDLSGTLVTASGVAACRPRALALYGRSTQAGTPTPSAPVPIVSVAGINLLDPAESVAPATIRGLTATYEGDGWFRVSGTVTSGGAGILLLWGSSEASYNLLDGGDYALTVENDGLLSANIIGLQVYGVNVGGTTDYVVYYDDLPRYIPASKMSDHISRVCIYFTAAAAGTSVNGRIRVQMAAGSTAYPYVPYGNAGLWARGKNLLDGHAIDTTNKGVTVTGPDADGWYTVSGTVTGTNASVITIFGTQDAQTLIGRAIGILVETEGTVLVSGKVRFQIQGILSTGQSDLVYVDASRTLGYFDGGWISSVRLLLNSTATGTTLSGRFRLTLSYGNSVPSAFSPYTETVTPVPLDGHALRSLPDGTRDELTVDERGHAVLVQRVGSVEITAFDGTNASGGRPYGYKAISGKSTDATGNKLLCDKLTTTNGSSYYIVNNPANVVVWGMSGQAQTDLGPAVLPLTVQYALATPVAHDLGTIDPVPLCGPDLTAQAIPTAPFALTALLKTGRSTVMWDGEELGAGWTFVSDRREQLLPTDVATIDVPGRDGALFGGVTRAVRQVTLALYVLGPVGERAPHVRELAARLAVDGPRPLMFSDEAPLWRMAVPNAESDSEVYYDAEGYTDVEFVCPDPWLYGEERSVTVPSGGSVTFTVGGTAPTWPTITASATGSSQGAWILRLDDSSQGIYAAIASGVTRPVVADCDARTLTVNNTTSMLAPSYDWPELTPGTHTLAMTQGTGAATVTWTERWW